MIKVMIGIFSLCLLVGCSCPVVQSEVTASGAYNPHVMAIPDPVMEKINE